MDKFNKITRDVFIKFLTGLDKTMSVEINKDTWKTFLKIPLTDEIYMIVSNLCLKNTRGYSIDSTTSVSNEGIWNGDEKVFYYRGKSPEISFSETGVKIIGIDHMEKEVEKALIDRLYKEAESARNQGLLNIDRKELNLRYPQKYIDSMITQAKEIKLEQFIETLSVGLNFADIADYARGGKHREKLLEDFIDMYHVKTGDDLYSSFEEYYYVKRETEKLKEVI